MDPQLAASIAALVAQQSTRSKEIGDLMMQQAVENSGRLSGMLGIRAAQTNPIEAASIETLKQAGNPGNSTANAVATALAAMFANLANRTPTEPPK